MWCAVRMHTCIAYCIRHSPNNLTFIGPFIDNIFPGYNHLNIIATKYKMTISSTKTKSMAMWGNHIQGVKIVINDNIIEQVTDFKYLGYRISEYGSRLEDKLQTYDKIIGAIRRHFGKQMNKETKLRIHNITAKAALKFGSEEKRGTTLRSNTDEIFDTLAWNSKTR